MSGHLTTMLHCSGYILTPPIGYRYFMIYQNKLKHGVLLLQICRSGFVDVSVEPKMCPGTR